MLANVTLSHLTPEELLRTSQSGGPNAKAAQARVVDVFGDKLKQLTARTCRRYYLQRQVHEDVLAETYQQLFNPDIARFALCRGKKAEYYFRGLVQNAARKVMVQLGARRRQQTLLCGQSKECHQDVVTEDGDTVCERYRTPSARPSPEQQAEIRNTVMYILAQATPTVRRALELCYWDDWPLQSIAKHLGVSRFILSRQIRRFFEAMNARLGRE